MTLHPPDARLVRETVKGAGAGFLGAVVPGLAGLCGAEAAVVHAMRDVAVGLMPMIFINALMSALIPAVITLRREGRGRPAGVCGILPSLVGPAAVVLGLAAGATVLAMGLIHLVAIAFSLTGLAAAGAMLLRATQAVLVASVITPLTIVLLSSKSTHG